MDFISTISFWFNELPRARKIAFSAFTSALMLSTLLLIWWCLSPSYAVLFTQLDTHDTQQILAHLEQNHIPYQLRHDGRDILIDKQHIAATRLQLMANELNVSGQVGFELFDKNDFSLTDFSQKINFQRALQGELERTIMSLSEVYKARVHLVIPEQHLFTDDKNSPKAAITLHLKSPLNSKQISSIQHLISASVAYLKTNNVVVVDQHGTTLSTSNELHHETDLQAKKAMEHYLTNKIMSLLQTIFPNSNLVIKVDVLLNYDELQRELIKPKIQGLITHKKTIKHALTDKTAKDKTNEDVSQEKTYQLGSEKELFKRANGTIEHLSVSVVLPKDTPRDEQEQVKRLVRSAVGFNEQRGDSISVEALITATVIPSLPQWTHSVPMTPRFNSSLITYSATFLFGSSAITLLLIQKKRRLKRQILLNELTQWLEHHE